MRGVPRVKRPWQRFNMVETADLNLTRGVDEHVFRADVAVNHIAAVNKIERIQRVVHNCFEVRDFELGTRLDSLQHVIDGDHLALVN